MRMNYVQRLKSRQEKLDKKKKLRQDANHERRITLAARYMELYKAVYGVECRSIRYLKGYFVVPAHPRPHKYRELEFTVRIRKLEAELHCKELAEQVEEGTGSADER